MNALEVIVNVALIHLAIVVSPGPNFVMVAQNALRSRWAGLATACGVAVVALTWAGLAALGLGAILAQYSGVVRGLKLVGAAYLVYVGVKTWLNARPATALEVRAKHPNPFLSGVLTNLTNPQSVLFFGAMFGAAIPAEAGFEVRAACVLIACLNALAWYSLVALVLSNGAIRSRYTSFKQTIERVTGACMVFFGARLALSR